MNFLRTPNYAQIFQFHFFMSFLKSVCVVFDSEDLARQHLLVNNMQTVENYIFLYTPQIASLSKFLQSQNKAASG